jgi:triacylglycerol lipase
MRLLHRAVSVFSRTRLRLARGARWATLALPAAAVLIAASCGSTGSVTAENSAATGAGGFITGAGGTGGAQGATTTHAATTTASVTTGGGGQGGAAGSGPPYPFVLAHGFMGFQMFAGLDFETYFYDVKAHLAAQGEVVATPAVDPFNSSDVRGAELLAQIQEFIAETGAAKVNIIGHSQGGLDARVVANLRPDLVASVVTISTPHHGSPVGDIAMKLLADPNEQQIIDQLVKLLGGPLYDEIGNATSLTAALYLFSQPGITAFNAAHPDSPGVFYASIAGRSNLHLMGGDCDSSIAVPFIQPWGSDLDPINPLLGVFALVLDGTDATINDGLVRAKDAQWGEYWGCLPADHLDEIGQLLGEGPGVGNDWKYLDFYTQVIAYMRSRGY